jgi:hypothetical protein
VPGDQAQREGQVAAAARDPGGGVRVGAGGNLGDGPAEVRQGLVGREPVHGQVGGGGKRGEAAPAGDQYGAPRRLRQQRADLVGVDGVVQHHEGAGAGEAGAVGRGAGRQFVRDLLAGYPQQAQEAVQYRGRIGGRLGGVGVEAAQVDEQHPVEEIVPGEEMPRPDGELGLADPGHPGDHGDHDRTAAVDGAAP